MRSPVPLSGLCALILLAAAGPVLAQAVATPVPADDFDTASLARELARVLGFVILIESAMAALFRWRAYRVLLGGRALKTPIMFAVGWLVVTQFHYDIVARLLQIADPGSQVVQSGTFSQLLSALVIAGGSSGIADIFRKLGLRPPIEAETPAKRLGKTEAYLSVQIERVAALGEVQIALRELDSCTEPPIAGSVGERPLNERLRDAFGFTRMRFPREEGQIVKALKDYEITLIYRTEDTPVPKPHPPLTVCFAPGALVDLRLTA